MRPNEDSQLANPDILRCVAVNLFSEFIGGDRSSASIASNGSFCIINNISVNAKNLKTAQV